MTKYRAKPVVVDNVRFHSTKEARRYVELKLLRDAGEIGYLQLQPEFRLCASGVGGPVGVYRADFSYTVLKTGQAVVEDVKGMDTPLSKFKRKFVLAQYGIEVLTT